MQAFQRRETSGESKQAARRMGRGVLSLPLPILLAARFAALFASLERLHAGYSSSFLPIACNTKQE